MGLFDLLTKSGTLNFSTIFPVVLDNNEPESLRVLRVTYSKMVERVFSDFVHVNVVMSVVLPAWDFEQVDLTDISGMR